MKPATTNSYIPPASLSHSFLGTRLKWPTDPYNLSPFERHISQDIQDLTSRIEILERALKESILFGQSLLEATKKLADRHMESYKQLADKTAAAEGNFYSYRVIQSLAQASRIYPKTKTVIFVGRGYFGDNIKYAFLAFNECAKNKGIACYFLANNPQQYQQIKAAGFPCLSPVVEDWVEDDAKILLSASVAVLCDNFHPFAGPGSPVPWALLQGAKLFQLWHGIPYKEIGFQHVFAPTGDNTILAALLESSGPFEVMVAPSAASRNDWMRWFSFHHFAPIGYPRNDVFFREMSATDMINIDAESFALMREANQNGAPVILYAPTFRDRGGSIWFEKANIDAFAEHCRAQGYLFSVNLHPYEQGAVEELRGRYPGVRFVEPNTDVYPLVKYTDILITDHSSLAFDFLLLDRPIVFYRPDHDQYMMQTRSLIKDHALHTPGDVVMDIPALTKATDDAVAAMRQPAADPFRDARRSVREKFFDCCDGRASQRFNELVVGHLEKIFPDNKTL